MPRIVSGVKEDFQDPGLAFLAGHEHATQRGQEQRAAQMDQFRLGLQIQEAQHKYEAQKAKALEDVNARVQMGDVDAWMQQARELEAANKHPDQQWFERGVGIRSQLKPGSDAEKLFDAEFGKATVERQKQGQYAAAQQAIQTAQNDGLIAAPAEGQPDEFTTRLQSGESPDTITADLGKLRQKREIETLAQQKNAEAVAQMDAMIQAFPAGDERLAAEYEANAYKQSPSKMSEPGSGPAALKAVQMKLLAGQQHLDAAAGKRQKEMLEYRDERLKGRKASAKGQGFYDMGQGPQDEYLESKLDASPQSLQGQGARLTAEKGARYPENRSAQGPPEAKYVQPAAPDGKTASASSKGPEDGYSIDFTDKPPGEVVLRTITTLADSVDDEAGLVKRMQEQGIALTRENAALVKKVLRDKKSRAAAN